MPAATTRSDCAALDKHDPLTAMRDQFMLPLDRHVTRPLHRAVNLRRW